MERLVNSIKMSFFSKAEKRVAEYLARGYSEKEIANILCLSKNTVSNHLRHIRENNGLTKNIEVVLLYIAELRKKKFSLSQIRKYGVSSLLSFGMWLQNKSPVIEAIDEALLG